MRHGDTPRHRDLRTVEDTDGIDIVTRPLRGRDEHGSGTVLTIAAGNGMASLSMNFWIPFLPLFMLELGAPSSANALFWVGVAATGQGIARLVAGPLWGVLSDRVGRKLMFIRALYFATVTTLIAAVATEPWHVAIALACQGLFSGFSPAAIALTSVIVPESKLANSLGTITAAQHIGTTAGPALGALLAAFIGMRGAIVTSALLPAIAATAVLIVVPRDTVTRKRKQTSTTAGDDQAAARRSNTRFAQFALAVTIFFVIFSAGQLVRLTAPVALSEFGGIDATSLSGVAFTVAGLASLVGVLLARWVVRPGKFARIIAAGMAATAVAHVLLAMSPNAIGYVAFFALISLLQAALVPASNTLIAANVPRNRRGTAFGIASGAQAISFIAGPMGAAAFAAISLTLGYGVLAAAFGVFAVFVLLALREPPPID